ncbi:MAG: FtsX-like permease family protein [Lachnospiraceae bacterium]|nr:FtsX-like permease family protein [Lachnospiraceae bacterium]MDD3615333.1 FtsX-like permease family protein [Lachnospiraceae bacterium]
MYSFVALLMLMGLTNVISTLSTNVLMRSQEFAVLKSIGMTSESLKKMLKYESAMCSIKALLYGVPIGIAMTVVINLPIRKMFPIAYHFPWIAILLCILAVSLITWSITVYAAHKLKSQNIIETIRAESGR